MGAAQGGVLARRARAGQVFPPDAALDTNSPTPSPPLASNLPKYLEGPVHIWSHFGAKCTREIFSPVVGSKISFLLPVYTLKMLRVSSAIQICMQNMKKFLTLDLPYPAPQTWLLRPYPLGGNFFFKNPTYVCSK